MEEKEQTRKKYLKYLRINKVLRYKVIGRGHFRQRSYRQEVLTDGMILNLKIRNILILGFSLRAREHFQFSEYLECLNQWAHGPLQDFRESLSTWKIKVFKLQNRYFTNSLLWQQKQLTKMGIIFFCIPSNNGCSLNIVSKSLTW